jgi:DNA repair protein RadC
MRCKKNFNLPVSLAMRAAIEQLKQKPISFGSSIETRQYLRLQLEQLEREVFVVLFLDNQHRLIANETTSLGTINATSVYPREIVKAVLSHNAAAVILAHNHPSGLAEPRNADRLVTERLKDALSLIDVRILDHVVVGQGESMSFAEQGWL